MALIKCPECGREISDTVIACPHCGFRIQKETDFLGREITKKDDEDIIVVVKRDRNQGTGASGACIILGIFLLPILIGLGLLFAGIQIFGWINKNNGISKELVYFDKKNNEFIVYDLKGSKHTCKPESFRSSIQTSSGAAIKNKFTLNNQVMGMAVANDMPNIDKVLNALK